MFEKGSVAEPPGLLGAVPPDVAAFSRRGTGRPVNEDGYLALTAPAPVLAVADGVGGRPGGARASDLVVRALRRHVEQRVPAGAHPEAVFEGAIEWARRALARVARSCPELARMGTTLTAALARGRSLVVAHLGDSRCYRLRNSRLERLTRDHTLAEFFVERGILSPERASRSRWKHALIRVLNARGEEVRPDLLREEILAGDMLLLATDGLVEALGEGRIEEILQEARSAAEACGRFVREVETAAASDDATAVVARFPGGA
ncbi:MAG TPA: protein phosphatase 2C domain-containing protein [Planctomycetota bacterium]|nr:protein phosphatase 2C domain-containing protein [Planctomycetota bacterium]